MSESHEERAHQPARVEDFYREVLGWDVLKYNEDGQWAVSRTNGGEYYPITDSGVRQPGDDDGEATGPCIGVFELDLTEDVLGKIKNLKGKHIFTDETQQGFYSLFKDPAGNLFIIIAP